MSAIIMPSRPLMPTEGMCIRKWYRLYTEELKAWFRWCYARDVATRAEWRDFVVNNYVAEQELEE